MPLPLILAGPILRRVEPRLVSVWVALSMLCRVDFTVWQGARTVSTTVHPLGGPGVRRRQSPCGWETNCISPWSPGPFLSPSFPSAQTRSIRMTSASHRRTGAGAGAAGPEPASERHCERPPPLYRSNGAHAGGPEVAPLCRWTSRECGHHELDVMAINHLASRPLATTQGATRHLRIGGRNRERLAKLGSVEIHREIPL